MAGVTRLKLPGLMLAVAGAVVLLAVYRAVMGRRAR